MIESVVVWLRMLGRIELAAQMPLAPQKGLVAVLLEYRPKGSLRAAKEDLRAFGNP